MRVRGAVLPIKRGCVIDTAPFRILMSRPEIALQQKSNEYERKRKTVR